MVRHSHREAFDSRHRLQATVAEPTTIDLSGVQPYTARFDLQNTVPIAYRPWHNGPYHVTMGKKSVDPLKLA